jgi:hypothetical protein
MHQPHDKLFKAGFSDPKTKAGFLSSQLPPALAAAIDWSSLRLEPGSFIDSQFRQSESDLLFHARAKEHAVAIYLLFEHQTIEDRQMPLRLLRYMVRIWENHLKPDPGVLLPVIVPVVLAQNDRRWVIKPDLASLLEIPADLEDALRPFVPDFAFRLIQLAEIPFEGIAGTPAGIMILRTLKAERSGDLLADPVWDESLLDLLPRLIFEMLLRYILHADIDKDDFDNKIKMFQKPETLTAAMSLAEQLRQEGHMAGRQEGRQEGRREGHLEGRQEAILSYLEIRFGPVPQGLEEAMRRVADPTHLESLQRASYTCSSIEEFAAAL